jgi:hypothetical protein
MFVRNTDTGKWFNQIDTLSKDNYDDLRQDLEKVRLYSKCLSGSTYLPIDGFENIYNTFDIQKIGFYISESNTQVRRPLNGPVIPLTSNNSDEFYTKYLKENAFTIKNLFTPNKLIDDQLDNYLIVDVSTDEEIIDLGQVNTNYIIDGVRLVEGNRVLVKNQTSIINLSNNIDPEVYFSTTEIVSEYFLDIDNITSKTYFWYNNQNGIYLYTENKLVKTSELDSYDDVYRYSVVVSSGEIYREKQFHLNRLRNGYFPISSEGNNMQFVEKKNWVLRNRVDYNNIFDINYYDIIQHSTQSVYVVDEGRTYSIPPRTIAVGEFGVIINNQDKLSSGATFSQSHIISNKFKVNLRNITEVDNYYWCCGDEGTLLKISKQNFKIERIDLGETNHLKSISFFSNIYGKVVGEYNTIWWTKDGGLNWSKLEIPELDIHSYNKVIYYDLNQTYVAGDRGIFIEFSFVNGAWSAYKRKVAKQLSPIDEYVLFDDINDLLNTKWTKLVDYNYSTSSLIPDFGSNLTFTNTENNTFGLSPNYKLQIEFASDYFSNAALFTSDFYVAIKVSDSLGNIVYVNSPNFGSPFTPPGALYTTWDMYNSTFNPPIGATSVFKPQAEISLPYLSDGTLQETKFKVDIEINYNYDAQNGTISPSYGFATHSYVVDTKSANLLVLGGNENNIICYDKTGLISNSQNQFIYLSTTQSFSDVRSLSKTKNGIDIYVVGDKIYNFSLGVFTNNGTVSNVSTGTANLISDKFVNKLVFDENLRPYIAGNNSLLQFIPPTTTTFVDLDPTFNSKIKSRLLFLDYDIASKLNFFTDDGEYRLPNSVSFTQSLFTQSLVVKNITSERNWLSYYKDAEKTFTYYSSISDLDRVEFSTTFSSVNRDVIFNINPSEVTSSLNLILPFAPSLATATFSRFIQHSTPISSPLPIGIAYSNLKLFLYKYLLIFKINRDVEIGEVLRLTSNAIDCNLVVNRIERYLFNTSITNDPKVRLTIWPIALLPGQEVDTYVYCYSEFNDNIIKNLQLTNANISIRNLNRYNTVDKLVEKFNLHPISIGYNMATSSNIVTISPRFNNKTAYYNLQSTVVLGTQSKNMEYQESFLNFGYSPTYNILDYLEKVDNRFYPNYRFSVMPEFYSLVGSDTLDPNSIYIDLTVGQISATVSNGQTINNVNYYRYGTNQIVFGNNLKFYWDALFIYTFINLTINSTYTTNKLLITKKYYSQEFDGWVMEFNKKIEVDPTISNSLNINTIDLVSRNSLELISSDLQTLNNIQRSSTTKSVQFLTNFTNLEGELSTKISTDSYLKILVSDYNIREFLSAIIYTDEDFQMAMNLLNVEREVKYKISNTFRNINDKLALSIPGEIELKEGDLIELSFNGGTFSSEFLNPQYFGLHTVISTFNNPVSSFVITSLDYDVASITIDSGTISFIKKDPFFNYLPVDLFDLGSDKKVKRAIQINPENYVLDLNQYNLENVDLENFRYELVDGLSLEDLTNNFSWVLEAEISEAILGRDKNGNFIWYSGIWHCGRWFGGTWYSGRWVNGDWYRGIWNSNNTTFGIISITVDDKFVDNSASRWFNGRWFDGTWNGGTWYFGRRYSGDWNTGNWYGGIWNDGKWNSGTFQGGIWVRGVWESGIFNCNSEPAYWLDGQFKLGDFENGIWYNGQFGNDRGILARFGTKSSNSRTSLWHGGKWIDGEFHSNLNIDSSTGLPTISEIHKYSIWRTGIWLKGTFYGGIAYNIDFKNGSWFGGILEEIQVIGVDPILPATSSTNSIILNGIFKFNTGDEIWVIDDDRDGAFSPLGNNRNPLKYRINKIVEDDINKQTKVFLNYNLSSLGVDPSIATASYNNVETGLRVVSHFKDSYWKSGLWTNGIFDGGQFDTGIWYNGVFLSGFWGN